jgi:hypothetical protein
VTAGAGPSDLLLQGTVTADGAEAGTGGAGGTVVLDASPASTDNLTLSGLISASGGRGVLAGPGGVVTANTDGTLLQTASGITAAPGGEGINQAGGEGGDVTLNGGTGLDLRGFVNVSGGPSGAGPGGAGGMASLTTLGTLVSRASIFGVGGDTFSIPSAGGMGGTVLLRAISGANQVLDGQIDVGGGENSSGAGGSAGMGGRVTIQSVSGPVQQAAFVGADGGLSFAGTGGEGGTITLCVNCGGGTNANTASNSGTLVSRGGPGVIGGAGGRIEVLGNDSAIVETPGGGSNTGSIDTSGGSGFQDGGRGGFPGPIRLLADDALGGFQQLGTLRAVFGRRPESTINPGRSEHMKGLVRSSVRVGPGGPGTYL